MPKMRNLTQPMESNRRRLFYNAIGLGNARWLTQFEPNQPQISEVSQIHKNSSISLNTIKKHTKKHTEVGGLKTLDDLYQRASQCHDCELSKTRNQVVFGIGNVSADIVFVGEGPGEEEDKTGLPFVGKAGQLLTLMLEAIDLTRESVYICNVVKCRPPNNRTPLESEITACKHYLESQLRQISPKIIVALGATAARSLLGNKFTEKISLATLRESVHTYGDPELSKLIITYHPSYLLRSPGEKAKAWSDLKIIKKTLKKLKDV